MYQGRGVFRDTGSRSEGIKAIPRSHSWVDKRKMETGLIQVRLPLPGKAQLCVGGPGEDGVRVSPCGLWDGERTVRTA